MKSLKDIGITLHSRYLATLNMYRFIKSESFEQAYAASSEEEKNIATELIETLDKPKLVSWVKRQLRQHNLIEVLDVRYLRTFGQELGVRNYAILTRAQLITAIQHRIGEKNGRQKQYG